MQVFTSSYTPSKIEDGDVYKCKVTDHLGNFYDLYWHFTVPEEGTGLVLEYEEIYQVPYGSDVSLKVTAASGDTDTPITYQWYSRTYDWNTDEEELILLPGQTQPVLVLQNLQEFGEYVCEVTQGDSSQSAQISVSVYSKLKVDMPENANSPFVIVPDSEGKATLSVNARTDQGSLEYQWRNQNYTSFAEGVSTVTVSEPGYYTCDVSDGISRETVRFVVGYPTTGITDMASAPLLSPDAPVMITHALKRMVYVKLEEEGEIGFRSVSYCQVALLNAAGDVISETEGFGDDFYYDPEEADSPAYLAITTDYQDGLDDPVTLVWYAGQGSGGYDDSEWGPWYVLS